MTDKKKPRRNIPRAFEARLQFFRGGLTNAMEHPELLRRLEPLGYGLPMLRRGLDMVEEVWNTHLDRANKKARWRQTCRRAAAKQAEVNKTYMFIGDALRYSFRDKEYVIESAGFRGDRKETFAGWRGQVEQCLDAVRRDETIRAELARAGVTAAFIENTRALFKEAVALNDDKLIKKAEAEGATAGKKQLLKELNEWMRKFYNILDVACADSPKLKAAAGFVVR